MTFSSAWNIVKMGDYEYPRELCCGITENQAAEQSWNFCPFCGETVPSEVVANYETIMSGHPEVVDES